MVTIGLKRTTFALPAWNRQMYGQTDSWTHEWIVASLTAPIPWWQRHNNLLYAYWQQQESPNSPTMTSFKRTQNATMINIHVMQCWRPLEECLYGCTEANPASSTNGWASRFTVFIIINTPTNPRDLPNKPSHYEMLTGNKR